MKFLIKAFLALYIATISCPCGLTGHQFCEHQDHVLIQDRDGIRTLRLKEDPTKISIDTVKGTQKI